MYPDEMTEPGGSLPQRYCKDDVSSPLAPSQLTEVEAISSPSILGLSWTLRPSLFVLSESAAQRSRERGHVRWTPPWSPRHHIFSEFAMLSRASFTSLRDVPRFMRMWFWPPLP